MWSSQKTSQDPNIEFRDEGLGYVNIPRMTMVVMIMMTRMLKELRFIITFVRRNLVRPC